MIKCTKCGEFIPDGSKYCGKCGTYANPLLNNICPNCRSEVANGLFFCDKCGVRLDPPVTNSVTTSTTSRILTISRELQFQCAANTYKVIVNGINLGNIIVGKSLTTSVSTEIVTVEIISTMIMTKAKLKMILKLGIDAKISFKIQWPGDIIASVIDAEMLEKYTRY